VSTVDESLRTDEAQAVLVEQPHQAPLALVAGAQDGDVRSELVLDAQAAVALAHA
jgi:hypothetical protein